MRKQLFFWSILVLFPIFLIELASFVLYSVSTGLHRPPVLGGPALHIEPIPDDYEFDSLAMYVNAEIPRHQELYAKHDIKLPPKEPGEFRVFLLGGSTVANLRKPPGDRIADHIQKQLRKLGVRGRVFNFGVPNYTSINELYLVHSKLVFLDPDLIVVYDGVNDVFYGSVVRPEDWQPNISDLAIGYHERMYASHALPPFAQLWLVIRQFSYTASLVGRIQTRLSSQNAFRNMSPAAFAEASEKEAVKRTANDPGKFASSLGRNKIFSDKARMNQAAVDVYVQNAATMARSVSRRKILFLHVLQPTAFTKKHLHPREQWSVDFNNAYYADFRSVYLETYARYRADLGRLASGEFQNERRVSFLDLSAVTDNNPDFIYDDYCHENLHGNLTQIVGDAIAGAAVSRFGLAGGR